MAELSPVPLPLLLRRAFLEYQREAKIFDLPAAKFFRGFPELNLSVDFHGHRAATPLGPAAGPHGQLAHNIALSWLGGSRIIELKTIQVLDELKIPRPCIDAANVGYNVEWSQELKLEQSLREYVKASMLVEILRAWLGLPGDVVYDMSVGYNLEGIRSPRVRCWIESMQNAELLIDELRGDVPAAYRDLPFRTRISDSISLSTFHGCPAGEIEGIVTFLLAEMGCHVCVKLNPTLLGSAEVEYLLHDVLGYREIQLHPPAFESDLQFDEALDLIPRLQSLARRHNRGLSLKFTNTLVVKNHKQVFTDDLMYMSGAPLHVLAMRLAQKFRDRLPEPIPMSFSGGIDAQNFASAVAMDFVPVTTCTDLLRPGGYSRLVKYLDNLATLMRQLGVTCIADFVRAYPGNGVDDAMQDPRYTWEHNKGVPRKIGAHLWLYDCINCDKCVPVCPNDANFVYEIEGERQLANYADLCNDCGNCDVFCPEDGGPNVEKPRFFSSRETYEKYAGRNGFYIDWSGPTIYGKVDDPAALKLLLGALCDPRHVNFVNAADPHADLP